MPVTPFHFGPGALIHALAPKHISFLAFCASNVAMDFEPLYYMLTHQYPLHRFLHTYIGATLAFVATAALFSVVLKIASKCKVPDPLQLQKLTRQAIILGAAAGAYSHIVFDSVMHSDIEPHAPFSSANGLHRIVSLSTLHDFCLLAGLVGVGMVLFRSGQTTNPCNIKPPWTDGASETNGHASPEPRD